MELPIPKKLEKLWDIWDIPACVLLSLLLQVFLVLFASLRQRSRNPFLLILIWSAYLIADWIAAVTIGLITKVQTQTQTQNGRHGKQDLYAFWASFLLLHLGGPDSITSFALEDNEFWLRHLFGLILQVMGTAYCIFLTLPSNNLLWLPTILVFVVGSVKYAERTMSLYLASSNQFGATVRVFGELDVGGTKFDFNLASKSDYMELLMVSYSLFQSFKGIVVGFSTLGKTVARSSRQFFDQIKENRNAAFKLIEYELSFMYEVLHTKVTVVRSRIGFIFRLSSFFLIIGAFLLFHFVVLVNDNNKDHEFGGFELSLTYALLIGAIGLDTISGIKLMFSDCILVSNNGLMKMWRKYIIPEFVLKRKRWCGSVSQYNMVDYCLDERWIWKRKLIPDCFRVVIDNIKFMLFLSSVDDIEELKCFIFEELTKRTGIETVFKTGSCKTDTTNYAQTVLQMHLATEICYHHETETELKSYTDETKRERRMCKMISDYMFYLLIKKPEMLGSSVEGNWKRFFQDTFAEAKTQLMENKIYDHVQACNHFMDNYNYVEDKSKTTTTSSHGNGIKAISKSLLSEACKRGQEIKRNNWKGTSARWLFCLYYAVMGCRPMLHAQQPSRGGELFTFTRFLIQHLVFLRMMGDREGSAF